MNRTICDILYEIEEGQKNHTYSRLKSQIEEIREAAQRMEDRLWRYKEILNDSYLEEYQKQVKTLKEEIFNLKAERFKLGLELKDAKKEENNQGTVGGTEVRS